VSTSEAKQSLGSGPWFDSKFPNLPQFAGTGCGRTTFRRQGLFGDQSFSPRTLRPGSGGIALRATAPDTLSVCPSGLAPNRLPWTIPIGNGGKRLLLGSKLRRTSASGGLWVKRTAFQALSACSLIRIPLVSTLLRTLTKYQPEAETITLRLPEVSTKADLLRIVHEQFVAWFGESTAGPINRYERITSEIWALLHGDTSS
jgi:hypothetical protein